LGELNEINQNNIILKKNKKSNKILIKLTSRVNQAKQYQLKVNFNESKQYHFKEKIKKIK
jgi:hypothetical protein